MSSLIVLCPHCLTWIVQAPSCPECAAGIDVDDPDPPDEVLNERFGERLRDLGPVRLLRRGWPEQGQWLATTEGLLFVPYFRTHPNGALEAVAESPPAGTSRMSGLLSWWMRPPWRRTVDDPPPLQIPESLPGGTLDLVRDAPGAFFIQRTSIRQIQTRWSRIQIERRPSRSVALTQSTGPSPRQALRSLIDFPVWRTFVAEL